MNVYVKFKIILWQLVYLKFRYESTCLSLYLPKSHSESNACVLSYVPFFATPQTVACQAPLSMDSPGKSNGVGCHALLHGIFPIQGLNLHLRCFLLWQAGSSPPCHLGRPVKANKKVNYSNFVLYETEYHNQVNGVEIEKIQLRRGFRQEQGVS